MSRRSKRNEELAFGSDSFMDVVANMVGIIIILIVIVGMHVRTAPAEAKAKLQREVAEQTRKNEEARLEYEKQKNLRLVEAAHIEEVNEARRREREKELVLREKEIERRRESSGLRQREAESKFKALAERNEENLRRQKVLEGYELEAAGMRAEAQRLEKALAEHANALAAISQASSAAAEAAKTKQAEAERIETALQHESETLDRRKATWESIGKEIEALRARIAQLNPKLKDAKRWVHYATPISKRVQQQEVHFRCLGNKVADIHLEELIERARDKMAVSGGANVISGVAGPIEGFRLSFIATRASRSLSDQLNNPYTYRVQLTGWEIVGESSDLGEAEAQAMANHSRFLDSLLTRPPGLYAVTLWVYPDSFAIAKALRAFLHERGYHVALRPLPHGIPIAGSPWGSASQVQ